VRLHLGDLVCLVLHDGVLCGWYGGKTGEDGGEGIIVVKLHGVVRALHRDRHGVVREMEREGAGGIIERCETSWGCRMMRKVASPDECDVILLGAIL